MPVNDDLGTRMKEFYENRSKTYLMRRTPVACRIDGKSFHTFTKYLKRPFDSILIGAMQDTMSYLCRNIEGCVLGYTQSDEITLILVDYARLDTEAWFDYSVQKLCSIAASMATLEFNRKFIERVNQLKYNHVPFYKDNEELLMLNHYLKACEKGAMFDARCFNIPVEEVTNLIYWRQLDAMRNSIQMVAQANFTHRELQGLNTAELQDKLVLEKGINWNNLPIYQKRGSCCVRDENGKWSLDNEIPIFKGDGREYIERLVRVKEDG